MSFSRPPSPLSRQGRATATTGILDSCGEMATKAPEHTKRSLLTAHLITLQQRW